MEPLSDRIALVTGASRGIGRACAEALALAGCDLVIHCHQRLDLANEALQAVQASGRRGLVVQADLAIESEVGRMVEQAEEALGPIDILVNNAGVAHPTPIESITPEVFDRELATNLRSAFLATQAVLPSMRARQWGRLVFVSSVAAQVGGVVGPHYAASKAGLHGLAHAYASQLAREGITANVVAPALIETDMVRSNPKATPALIPVGRFGTVEETADVVVMLARNGYVTGQTVNVNGGWYFS
ncbi:MAG TPA: 3-oxoacyl-ACP reductase family protein [Isosphaeraceae bacterium]|nr:3-oxoacyl-ACP reductase family protein [Isosphaeraceae bacterium]